MRRAFTLIITLCLFVACSRSERTVPGTEARSAERSPQSASAPPQQSPGITYDLPSGWSRVSPASSMRLDQAQIAGPGGDGELAVFFFGSGGGGGVEDNLARWADQMESSAPPKRENFEVNGFKVSWIDVSGTLQPSSMGMGPSTPQPDSRMYAAVVEGEGGPWFFKATGPAATMDPQRDAFVAMLKSIRAGTAV